MKIQSKDQVKSTIQNNLSRFFGISYEDATKEQIYKAAVVSVRDMLSLRRKEFNHKVKEAEAKRVYYLSIEFLLGRSLKNNLQNLGLQSFYSEALSDFGFNFEDICSMEDDAGLGNGGLGRLAACFLDSLSSLGYPAMGFSLLYEYGLFKQKIVDFSQVELPDMWLPSGEAWLIPRTDKSFTVRFGGRIEEDWSDGKLKIKYIDADEVDAIPYDMMISGAENKSVSALRLWKAQDNRNFNMRAFSQGEYFKAVEESTNAQLLSKVLYPEDNHSGGKQLRLMQQYLIVSASVQSIVFDHLRYYGTLDNLADKVAIHINDTHPTLCIPELMRVLVDEHSMNWDDAWNTTVKCVSYTNHTILPEALECWDSDMLMLKLPRIYSIIDEINKRFINSASDKNIDPMTIIHGHTVRMANLSIVGSHKVNGVSKLHSDILRKNVFPDFDKLYPGRFMNVTNGIAHRRWLCGSNPLLSEFIQSKIGNGYKNNPSELEKLLKWKDDKSFIQNLKAIKYENKKAFAEYTLKHYNIKLNPDSIFDVQVKRMHEYKRQLLNVLNIIGLYVRLKENPNSDIPAQTFIFGAKAAPGYYIAKEIISLICNLGAHIDADEDVRGKLKVVFLENYNVTLAEHLIPAADISEQISLAGKEASGTGNMKFMLNGALTIGTFDGANVEMSEEVGMDNIFIFGMRTKEVDELWSRGYESFAYYNANPLLKSIIEQLNKGFNGESFSGISNYLLFSNNVSDPYMCLADFGSYTEAREKMLGIYADSNEWYRKSLVNIAKAGFFAADRSITEYAEKIWNLSIID
ncbi:MAG: glycogen/starch/alpha-glucan phosphorylase [Eubacteriales bacterium]|nr:glycogen/starch/alpha-glucan phosphorylase [Eubacteriales bacterium]MDD4475577.1 glycogen/starch/alpha-glucan phosphorylase [Eubacteriales bacterium]